MGVAGGQQRAKRGHASRQSSLMQQSESGRPARAESQHNAARQRVQIEMRNQKSRWIILAVNDLRKTACEAGICNYDGANCVRSLKARSRSAHCSFPVSFVL